APDRLADDRLRLHHDRVHVRRRRRARRLRRGRAMTAPGRNHSMLLDVSDLKVDFTMPDGSTVHAVKGLDIQLEEGGSLAIIGESGSGKSVSMRALLGLLPSNTSVSGRARLDPEGDPLDLLTAHGPQLRRVRGREGGMLFQDATEAPNPSTTLERPLTETLLWHGMDTRREARRRAIEALGNVEIPEPERRLKMYPFQLSGGMRQRAM